MNPARSLGPALVAGDLSQTWIYVIGPFTGGLLAVGLACMLHARRDPKEVETAEGKNDSG